jgi:hypothetical protein
MATCDIYWRQGLTLSHDPDDIGDYSLDMTDVVAQTVGDTVISVSVTGTGVTAAEISHTVAGVVIFRVSGGTPGSQESVTVQITMASGRKQSRTINFNVLER